jgi:hypothetical protein
LLQHHVSISSLHHRREQVGHAAGLGEADDRRRALACV